MDFLYRAEYAARGRFACVVGPNALGSSGTPADPDQLPSHPNITNRRGIIRHRRRRGWRGGCGALAGSGTSAAVTAMGCASAAAATARSAARRRAARPMGTISYMRLVILCLATPAARIVSQVIVTLLGAQPRWAREKSPRLPQQGGKFSILGLRTYGTLRPAVLHGARSVRIGQDRPDTGSVSIAEH